jgi:hypothetical protein
VRAELAGTLMVRAELAGTLMVRAGSARMAGGLSRRVRLARL